VLSLLVDAAMETGWQCELWTRNELQPEYARFKALVRMGPAAWCDSQADALWCPGLPDKPTALPVVSTIHDTNPLMPDGRPWPIRAWRRLRFRLAVGACAKRSFQVVTDTEFARQSVESAFPALRGRLAVVPLYADRSISKVEGPAREEALAGLGLEPGYILFVGSLRRHKNWDGLIRAYADLPPALRDAHPLVLAGPARRAGDEANTLAANLGIEQHVTLLGTVPDSRIAALYSGADLFVFPSFMEGFGLPPLEAMSCGVPVAATTRTSVPEVLGKSARYFDPADLSAMAHAMRSVLEDRALAEELKRRGAALCSSYSPARTSAAMVPVLDAARADKALRSR
jgi:alpha-1,3-rhamnosyl/mannosyltransferase